MSRAASSSQPGPIGSREVVLIAQGEEQGPVEGVRVALRDLAREHHESPGADAEQRQRQRAAPTSLRRSRIGEPRRGSEGAARIAQRPRRLDGRPCRRAEPFGHRRQFRVEFRQDLLAVGPRFEMDRARDQPPGRPVGLEVDAGDDAIAEEEGQAVIAELALLGRRVDLDAVAEVEQALGARALPDDRIERRQERPRRDAAGQATVRIEIAVLRQPSTRTGRRSPASTSSRTRGFASATSSRK